MHTLYTRRIIPSWGNFQPFVTFPRFRIKEGPGGNLPMQGGALGFGLGFSKQDGHDFLLREEKSHLDVALQVSKWLG